MWLVPEREAPGTHDTPLTITAEFLLRSGVAGRVSLAARRGPGDLLDLARLEIDH